LIIRQENRSDISRIYSLVDIAFQTAKVSNGREQEYTKKLHASPDFIPKLALVAEDNREIIGHIMLTKTAIVTGNLKHDSLLLAPLSVALEHRKRGVGSQLVKESFELARKLGYTSVFVVGDPAFYCRFGFKSSILFGITHLPFIPAEFVMAYELSPGAVTGVVGTVTFT
jgi:predicted N-acetyltransferase YhbS